MSLSASKRIGRTIWIRCRVETEICSYSICWEGCILARKGLSNIVFCFRDLEGVFVFLDLIDVPHLSCNFYPATMLHKTKVTEALNSSKVVVLKFIFCSPLYVLHFHTVRPLSRRGQFKNEAMVQGGSSWGKRCASMVSYSYLVCLVDCAPNFWKQFGKGHLNHPLMAEQFASTGMSPSEITPEVFTSGSTIIWRSPLLKV